MPGYYCMALISTFEVSCKNALYKSTVIRPTIIIIIIIIIIIVIIIIIIIITIIIS